MPDPKKVLTTIRRATQAHAYHAWPLRGDRHARECCRSDGRRRLARQHFGVQKSTDDCGPRCHPGRHLILQELIHGPLMYPDDKGNRSHQLLDVFAALKCQYPQRVHMILGNHELSELTGRSIGKDGEGLNAKFHRGVETAYGESAGEIHAAYKALFAALPLAVRTGESSLRLPHSPRRR